MQENTPNTVPIVVDDCGDLARGYGIRGIPRTYLIGPSGDIVQVPWGFAGPQAWQMVQAMERLLPDSLDGAP